MLPMLFVISLITFILLLLLTVLPWKEARGIKIAFSVLLFVMSQKFLFFQLFGGTFLTPEMPRLAIIILSWLYTSTIFLLLFAIIKGFIVVLCRVPNLMGKDTISLPFSHETFLIYAMLVSLIIGAYGTYEAVRIPDVRTREVTLKNLPLALDGTKIAILSDLHASALVRNTQMKAIVAKTNTLAPDITLFAGDMADGSVIDRTNDVAPLADLTAKYGVIGCPGNHEYYTDYDDWLKKIRSLGMIMLENQHVTIPIKGENIVIAGLTDENAGHYGMRSRDTSGSLASTTASDIGAALSGTSQKDVRILLVHQPRNAPTYAQYGLDLQVSGHTHGGLMIGFDRIVAAFNNGYVHGLYQVGKMVLFVNPGTQLWSGFPVRIGVPAEITLLVLRSEK